MRLFVLCCLVSLSGCVGSARNEGFSANGPNSFLYSARTNTVMTENDDGTAERLRRDWIADALQVRRAPLFFIGGRQSAQRPQECLANQLTADL